MSTEKRDDLCSDQEIILSVTTWARNASRSTWLASGTKATALSALSLPLPVFLRLLHIESIKSRHWQDTVPALQGWQLGGAHEEHRHPLSQRGEAAGSERQNGTILPGDLVTWLRSTNLTRCVMATLSISLNIHTLKPYPTPKVMVFGGGTFGA